MKKATLGFRLHRSIKCGKFLKWFTAWIFHPALILKLWRVYSTLLKSRSTSQNLQRENTYHSNLGELKASHTGGNMLQFRFLQIGPAICTKKRIIKMFFLVEKIQDYENSQVSIKRYRHITLYEINLLIVFQVSSSRSALEID